MEIKYQEALNNKSDINEHIKTLYYYAKECEIILECGVREVVSSWAFLKGLVDNKKERKIFYGSDLYRSENIAELEKEANNQNVTYQFLEGNDLLIQEDYIKNIDLCFIDTWHVFGQLKRELNKFSKITNKYIIMHDTSVDAYLGESVREKMNIPQQMQNSGYSYHEIVLGLWPAILEFLYENPNWKLRQRFKNNNGLTILERIKNI